MSSVISYVPAIHQGYIKFFKEHPGDLYLLGGEFIKNAPRMERDIRAVDVHQMAGMIRSLGIMKSVDILKAPQELPAISGSIVMPDEELNRNFAKKYLSDKKINFVSTFLRWERQISTVEFEVPSDRVISRESLDKEIMGEATAEANKSGDWWRQIGAVAAKDNEILMVGHNKPLQAEDYSVNIFGDPRSNFDYGEYIELVKTIHAEAGLIAEAARKGLKLEGASMYVSTFPCPVCAKLIAAAGFKKVYYSKGYSMLDAEDILKGHKIEIIMVES